MIPHLARCGIIHDNREGDIVPLPFDFPPVDWLK